MLLPGFNLSPIDFYIFGSITETHDDFTDSGFLDAAGSVAAIGAAQYENIYMKTGNNAAKYVGKAFYIPGLLLGLADTYSDLEQCLSECNKCNN